ncbi:MAG: GT2 family glycosyltransferase [Planctomycetota bacterium]|jgi:GT2 family glycosyltransferase
MTHGALTISACIVLHNEAGDLPALRESLGLQSCPIDQVIFCLNGDNDAVKEVTQELFPGATIIDQEQNLGFAGGINACLAATDSTYVLLLNADVVLNADYVQCCLDVFDAEEQVGGVGGILLRSKDGEDCIDTAGFVMQPWLRIVDRAAGSIDLAQFHEREAVIGVCAAAAVFSRAALDQVAEAGAVMDEDFWMYKEDQDLCLRIKEAGWQVFFEPAAKGRHHRGWAPERRFDVPIEIRRHSLKNRYLLLTKHWRFGSHSWNLPILFLFEILLFVGLCLRDPKVLIGYARALALLPKMLAKRKKLIRRFSRTKKDGITKRLATFLVV